MFGSLGGGEVLVSPWGILGSSGCLWGQRALGDFAGALIEVLDPSRGGGGMDTQMGGPGWLWGEGALGYFAGALI